MATILILLLIVQITNLEHGVLGFGVLSFSRTRARTTADRIESFGYSSETHTVVTKDGYILNIFRITNSTEVASAPRPVVLMMHGLVSSSDCWVINGPSDALAFNLVDSGYDVWLGNGRGTPYGKRHLSMLSTERRFWRFSWPEIGVIDLPNTIDYILKETGQSSLHYVGHSQGTAIMFVLLSTQPQYNKKLKTGHMLAPIAYMKYARSGLIRYLSPILGTYSPLDPLIGDMPFLQQQILRPILGLDYCRSPTASPAYCSFLLFTIGGGVSGYLNNSLLPEIYSTHPASCSTHQAIHLIQLHVSGRFRNYDYGERGNNLRYSRSSPPDFKVANINPRFPLHFYYSDYDELSSKTDVENFSRILGNRSVNHFINLRQFAHLDFLWASNVKDVLNRGIVERMNKAEYVLRGNVSNIYL